MRKSIGLLPTLVLGLASAIVSTGPVRAAPVTYTERTTATGSLGEVPFTDESITLRLTNDTTNVVSGPPGITFINTGTAVVSVGGGPQATFTDPISVFVVHPAPAIAGFAEDGLLLLDTVNSAFGNYDLMTSIGPISGPAEAASPGVAVYPTSSGEFILDSVADTSTFTAAVSTAVPEPSSLMLLGVAFAGLGLLRPRRTQS